MKLKTLWLSHLVPYPPKGGVLQRAFNMVNELSKYSEIHLLSFIQKKLINTFYDDYESGLKDCKDRLLEICETVEFVEIPSESHRYGKELLAFKSLFSSHSYTVNWLRAQQFQTALDKVLRENEFDIVHADTISLAYYFDSFSHIKSSLDHHNIESDMMLRRADNEKNLIKKGYFYLEGLKIASFEKAICNRFDLNITCSKLDTQRLNKVIPNTNAIDIPNGVDIDYFKPSEEPVDKEKALVFAGRLNAYTNRKAILYFINSVWSDLKSRIPDVKLYVVGSNPPSEIGGIDKDIIVTGYVDDVRPYIEKASIYVCPITDGGGTKLKVLDALAMGMPIVGNEEAFEGIDIEHGKSAFIANNTEEYIKYIELLLNDKTLLSDVSKNALNLVSDKYDYKKIGSNLFDALSHI